MTALCNNPDVYASGEVVLRETHGFVVNMTGVHAPGHYPAADGHWDVVFDRCQLPLAWYSIERFR